MLGMVHNSLLVWFPASWGRLLLTRPAGYRFNQRDHWGKQGDYDESDDDAQHDHHDRFQNANQRSDEHVHVIIIVVGDLDEHLVQVAGLFADVDHVDHDGITHL